MPRHLFVGNGTTAALMRPPSGIMMSERPISSPLEFVGETSERRAGPDVISAPIPKPMRILGTKSCRGDPMNAYTREATGKYST